MRSFSGCICTKDLLLQNMKTGDSDPYFQCRAFLSERGGGLAAAGSEADALALQRQAAAMGRSLGLNDARIAASAVTEGVPILTNDVRFARFLNAIGIGGEGF